MESNDGPKTSEPSPRLKLRVESLSDLVFGLALSIGSVILVGKTPANGEDIAANVVLFGFGFAIIVLAWLGYSRSMLVLSVEVRWALVSNLLLLFTVAVEPYLFYVLIYASSEALADAASFIYALDLGGMFIMQAVLAKLVLNESRTVGPNTRPVDPLVIARFRRVLVSNTVAAFAFVISALPVFWVETPLGYLRFYLWSASFIIFPYIYAARRKAIASGKSRS